MFSVQPGKKSERATLRVDRHCRSFFYFPAGKGRGLLPPMPGKLKVVLGIQAISVVLSLINSSWFWAAVGLAILVALFKGGDTVRKVVVVLSVLGLIGGVLGLLSIGAILAVVSAAGGDASGGMGFVILGIAGVIFGEVGNFYTIWALTRQDVKDWMLAKSTGAAAAG